MFKYRNCKHVVWAGLLLAAHCNQKTPEIVGEGIKVGGSGAVTITDPTLMPIEQKFLSAEKPDNWGEHKGTHVPFVEASRDSFHKIWTIKATVPFVGNNQHYIEHIILVNHRSAERQKKNLGRGTANPLAQFSYKEKEGEKLYVLAKCNMHDIWMSPVVESTNK